MLKKLPFAAVALLFVSTSILAQNYATDYLSRSTPRAASQIQKNDLSLTDQEVEASNERCLYNSRTEALMAIDPQYRAGVIAAKEETNRIMAELESGMRAAPPVYTIPVVFHVIHKGEAVGTGTNISDAQILSAIDALNRDYRETSADGGIGQGNGPDTEIQFCLTTVNESGQPHSGINRVNGTGVSGYSTSGITSSNETSVKALSRWDNRYFLNIWVVSEIDGNGADLSNPAQWQGGTLGYAYQPSNPVTLNASRDGVVAVNLCVGNDPNQNLGYRLWPWGGLTNRTLTHEVGHFLGLSHTFSDNTPSICSDGDGFSDTPNAKQLSLSSCTNNGNCSGQLIEDYMDYTPEECQNMFTNQQTSYMRSVLTGARTALVNTNNCSVSSNDYDAGISSITTPSGNLCDVTFTPVVTLYNYGTTTLTSVNIQYYVDAQTPTTFPWSGSLSSGSSTTVTLNSVTTTTGNHSFTAKTVSGTLNGSNNDQDTGNDQSTSSFNVGSSGTQVTLTLDLDCYGSETTWEIRNANNQVVESGGPYADSEPNGQQIVESFCLAQGCYDFTIFDSYNPPDGMAGAQYTGCNVNGDYEITDENNVLVQMTAVNANFGASATHNFCVGGGGNPTTSCGYLLEYYGEGFFVNETDLPSFNVQAIDNDQEPVSTNLPTGFTSNWMAGFYDEVAPGDTNWFLGVTSWHEDNTVPADNWLTFGPVTMLSDDGEISWKHAYANNTYRDGYEVLVGTSGTSIANFNGATVLYSVADNDASTDGDTDWAQQSVSLPAGTYANQSLYFAFHHNADDQLLLYIDDILVEGCESITVGIDGEDSFEMNVFPNPSNQNFTFTYAVGESEPLNFTLLNAMGQQVWMYTTSGNRTGREVIDTAHLASGVYTLVMKSDRYNSSRKLILSK
ncbi:MAG: choice-of-anchor J domain-containing protein [Flavobacteriales bacterium]|nr:choice-of-anchor J domain-containing protein [Flavobacteriales bacterium]